MGVHIGAQDCVDAGLIAALAPKPRQQIGIDTHCDRLFAARHDNACRLPECRVGRPDLRVLDDCRMNLFIGHAAQPLPVGAGL
jgi:hypothetical protein